MGLFMEVRYSGDWWGEDPLYETDYDTVGDLFRALSGRDKSRPWVEPLGRCMGRIYVDGDNGEPRQVGWEFWARNPAPVRRGDEQPTGLRIAWVTVKTKPDTIRRTEHFANFGR